MKRLLPIALIILGAGLGAGFLLAQPRSEPKPDPTPSVSPTQQAFAAVRACSAFVDANRELQEDGSDSDYVRAIAIANEWAKDSDDAELRFGFSSFHSMLQTNGSTKAFTDGFRSLLTVCGKYR